MPKLPYIILIFSFVLLGNESLAQSANIAFNYLSTKDGLSNNNVTCFLQDRQGFIWIGTEDGLNCYNGYEFKTYRSDENDPNTLANNQINAIYEDNDRRLWVGTPNGLSRYNASREEIVKVVKTSRDEEGKPFVDNGILDSTITQIVGHPSGTLWLVVEGKGIASLNPITLEYELYQSNEDNNSLSENNVTNIFFDSDEELWIGTQSTGLNILNIATKEFRNKNHEPNKLLRNSPYTITAITKDSKGKTWIAGRDRLQGGFLQKYSARNKTIQPYYHQQGNTAAIARNDEITSIFEDNKKNIWIGMLDGGLSRWNAVSRQFINYYPDPVRRNSLPDTDVTSIYQDNSGLLWFGTKGAGICLYNPSKELFRQYEHQPGIPNSLNAASVFALEEDRDGNLWIGTQLGGLNFLDRTTNTFTHYTKKLGTPNQLQTNSIFAIEEDKNQDLWLGTDADGLYRMNKITQQFEHFTHNDTVRNSLSHNTIYSIHADRNGILWVGTMQGLNRFVDSTKAFVQYLPHPRERENIPHENTISCIYEDSRENFWLGTWGGGLKLFRRGRKSFVTFPHKPKDKRSLSSNEVTDVIKDRKGRLWVATTNGLNRMRKGEDGMAIFDKYKEKDGLPSNVIYGILEDKKGNLWITTNNGLSNGVIDQETGRITAFKNYNESDGLQGNQFNLGAAHKGRRGNLYIGGKKGFNIFDPLKIESNQYIPPIVLTKFVKVYRDQQIEVPILDSNHIELSHQERMFSFEFAALNYIQSEDNQYAYKIEPVNEEWIELGRSREVTFPLLPYGNYNVRIKASNNDGVWNEEGLSFKLTIHPPFWRTRWAYASYVLLAILSVLAYQRIRERTLRREKKRLEEQVRERTQVILEQKEKAEADKVIIEEQAEKLKALDALKSRFFANISHELRTPLTLMLAPIDVVLKDHSHKVSKKVTDNLHLSKRHGQKLLSRIKEILDLSKLEAGALKLSPTSVAFYPLIQKLFLPFQAVANSRKMVMTLNYELPKDLLLKVDEEKFEQIISNLLSNAVKYCNAKDTIECIVEETTGGNISLRVKDTGPGIPKDDLPSIFDRFYQSSKSPLKGGTGIGLALAKELAELHGGTLKVNSTLGEGSVFTFDFPKVEGVKEELRQAVAASAMVTPQPKKQRVNKPANGQKTPLLLVEDHHEMRAFIRENLEKTYHVLEAENGKEALKVLKRNSVKLVITDVMMPQMDGLELIEHIKKDYALQDISIIALTARSEMEDKLHAFQLGVDDYITKPFNIEELTTRIQNLLTNRANRENWEENAASEEEEAGFMNDRQLIKYLEKLVQQEIGNTNFSVSDMVAEVPLSERQLYRIIKRQTGFTPAQFIKEIRLLHARKLLESGQYQTISQVSYAVGFKKAGYFTKVFRGRFGKGPGEYL